MASAYRKKDMKEEMDMLRKERGRATSVSTPANKVVGGAFVAPVPIAPTMQPTVVVVTTTAPGAGSGEPSISEELDRHKKRQKRP